ncbi:MAG: nitrite reductase, partial [Myxococcales bacterium]|nr:nitrite reductase [Myxococcales bacterium]
EFSSVDEVFAEFCGLTRNYQGLTYAHLGREGKLWPCPDPEGSDGTVVLFTEAFPSGRGKMVAAEFAPPAELPDDEYPIILTTGRLLEHWHTGTMTRRSAALGAIEPEPYASVHPETLQSLGIADGEWVSVSSRRGSISLRVRASKAPGIGAVFIPFCWREAAANVLTSDKLDPYGKIPEFKFCAVRIERADPEDAAAPAAE